MMDVGHVWTEGEIRKLQGRIRDAYAEAADDIEAKMDAFVAKFAAKDRDLRAQLKAGKISKADYQGWLAGQVFQRKQWQATLDDLTATLARTNEVAMQIINDTTPEAFAYNANWASYTMERQMDAKGYDLRRVTRYKGAEVSPEESATARTAATVRFGFGLYDANAVRLLLRDEPNLLPPSRVDILKDRKWNMANITRQILQGIVQGEGLEQVAKRLRNVEEMNVNASLTHARTAMTGAQNAGRMESYRRAEQMGIDVQREWIATLDGYTRKLHQLLDGQRRAQDEPFEVMDRGRTYKIMYPGDPEADPRMVYNCRCTLGAFLPDSLPVNARRRDDDPKRKPIRHMTYPEWLEYKKNLMSGAEDVKILD